MEILFELALAAFLVFFLTQITGLSERTVAGDIMTAKGFPMIVAIGALVFVAVIIVRHVLECKKTGKKLFGDVHIPKKTLIVAGELLAYILVLNQLGFIFATLLFTYANTRILGFKDRKIIAAFALLVTACFVVVFGKVFYVPLPRGAGIFRELSYHFY